MRTLLAGLLFVVAVPAFAQTSFPMITHAMPVAVQRGTSAEVTVEGQMNFAGAYKVLIDGTGVAVEFLPAKPKDPKAIAKSVVLKIQVEANAPLGVREFRIASTLGISSLGQLLIVDDPVVLEAPSVVGKPQSIPVPCVVCGRIEAAENVDSYTFAAKLGQVISCEVFAARIQDKIHDLQKHADPLISVLDSTGREVTASDDGYYADPVLNFTVPKDGQYTLQIRDAKYDGDPRWAYAMCVTDRPYVTHAFPLGITTGATVDIEPVVLGAKSVSKWRFTVPPVAGIHGVTFQPTANGPTTNLVPIVATRLKTMLEIEPNDTPKEATRIVLPCGVNGRIGSKRDLDFFAFTATKGKVIAFEVFARRFGTVLRSQLDSTIDVMTPDGKILISNDDANGKDAALLFTPPADGEYLLRIRDLNNKGGAGFVYFLDADFATPNFTIKADPSKAMIGPGSRTAWYVTIARTNGFVGPVTVTVDGLPKGVTVSPLTIPATMTQGLLVVSAAADAKVDASIVRVVGTADTLVRTASPIEEIYMPGGGRGGFQVGMQAVAITEQSDLLNVKVDITEIVLKPGEEVKIPVTVTRRADYDKPVSLDVILRHLGQSYGNPLPPGVTMVEGKSKTLLGTGSVGHITLKAASDAAPCDRIPICVQGYVAINFVVKIGYASEPIFISVKK